MIPSAGELTRLCEVQRRTLAGDGSGSSLETWTTYATVWASIVVASGSEATAARQQRGVVVADLQMRFLDGVSPEDRLVCGSDVWHFVAVFDPDGRRRELRGTVRRADT